MVTMIDDYGNVVNATLDVLEMMQYCDSDVNCKGTDCPFNQRCNDFFIRYYTLPRCFHPMRDNKEGKM